MTTLRTRKPTARVPWPLILVEGSEKAGKSWACAELSACDRVGQTYWLDLGEGAADEYGAIPGARYLVVEHNGTWNDIITQVEAVRVEAQRAADACEPPVALVIDSMTAEWDLLKGMADQTARRRAQQKARKYNKPAPGAGEEVQISMDLWNDATARHRRLMTLLMTFPGIVAMTARGKEVVALDDNGRPIERQREYKVEGQKNLAYDASVWVRMSREHAPVIVGARSVHAGVRPGVDQPKPVPKFSLEWLIFDVLKCDPREANARQLVEPAPAVSAAAEETAATEEQQKQAANPLRDEALNGATFDQLRNLYNTAKQHGILAVPVVNENGDDEPLGDLIYRLGRERKATAMAASGAEQVPAGDETQAVSA